MSLRPFNHEAQAVLGDGAVLRFTVSFRELDVIEGLLGQSMTDLLPVILGPSPRLGVVGKVLWALLREHHPEVTLDEAAGLMFGPDAEGVGMVIGDLFRRAFNLGEKKPEAKGKNPPRRRGASKPS